MKDYKEFKLVPFKELTDTSPIIHLIEISLEINLVSRLFKMPSILFNPVKKVKNIASLITV